jgi:hypothetical protein
MNTKRGGVVELALDIFTEDFITLKWLFGNCFENRPNTTDPIITNLVKNLNPSRNNKNTRKFKRKRI